MKRLFLFFLCAMLLTGCANSAAPSAESTAVSTILPPETLPATTAAPTQPEKDDLSLLREKLKEVFSFTISYQYMHLAYNGISQEITEKHAQDGSFRFISTTRVWDHTQSYESTDQAEYYYRYEDGIMVCYVCANGAEPQRMTLTKAQEQEIAASKDILVGPDGLLPQYLVDFRQESETAYSFRLPLDKVVADGTMLSKLVYYAFAMYGSEYDPDWNLFVGVTVEVDPKTMTPASFTFDFSEVKPYVLSDGALSGEYALETDLMYMVFTLDYSLEETISVPDSFIP